MKNIKLYTEEQVKKIVEKSRETGLTAEYLILATKGIELPSDEEIEKLGGSGMHPAYNGGVKEGAKWVIQQIKQQAE